MRCTERVIFTLAALGETGKPATSSQRADTVTASGEYLVRIALMAHIPDQPVFGRIEYIMDCRGQFDHA